MARVNIVVSPLCPPFFIFAQGLTFPSFFFHVFQFYTHLVFSQLLSQLVQNSLAKNLLEGIGDKAKLPAFVILKILKSTTKKKKIIEEKNRNRKLIFKRLVKLVNILFF